MKTPSKIVSTLCLLLVLQLSGCGGKSPEQRIETAKSSVQEGNFKAAVIELKTVLEKMPNNVEARLLLGRYNQGLGKWVDSEKELRKAAELGAPAEDVLPWLVRSLVNQGKSRDALSVDVPKSGLSPLALAGVMAERVNALIILDNPADAAQAISLADQALQQEGKGTISKELQLAKARLHFKNRQPDEAMQVIDALLQKEPKYNEALYTKAQLLLLKDKRQEALKVYQQIAAAQPADIRPRLGIFELQLFDRNFTGAVETIKSVQKIAPNAPQVLFSSARLQLLQGDLKAANENIQKVLRIAPDHMPSQLLNAAISFGLGNYEQSLKSASLVLSSNPQDLDAAKLVASNQIRMGDLSTVSGTLTQMLQGHPNDIQLLALAAEAEMRNKQYGKAMEYLDRASALQPANVEIKKGQAEVMLAMGKKQEATSLLDLITSKSETASSADVQLVLLHMGNRDYDGALKVIANLEKKMPNNPVVQQLRAVAYLSKGDQASARKYNELALTMDPGFSPAAVSLARLDMEQGKPDIARGRFDAILKKDANNLAAMLAMAELAALEKKASDYQNWLERAAKAHPKEIAPRAGLVNLLLGNNEGKKALAIAKDAVNANPGNLEALNLLGTAQMGAGDAAGAVSTLNTVADKAPNSAEAWYRLGLAQVGSNQEQQGRISMEKALKLNPAHLGALDGLLLLDVARKNLDVALRRARDFQGSNPNSPAGFVREADILLLQKQNLQASKVYERALALSGGLKEFVKLYESLSRSGNQKLAEQKLADRIKRFPNDLNLQRFAAEQAMVGGKTAEAIARYQQILAKTPNDATLLNNLANLYQRQKDSRALQTAEAAYKLAPQNAAVADTYGWILVEQGQASKGLEFLRMANEKAPSVPSVRYHYAVALAQSGNKSEAKKILTDLLKNNPAFPELQQAKAYLLKL